MIFSKLIIYHRVSRTCRRSKQDLLVNVHGFTFFSYDEMEAWVLRMPKGVDRIKVWSNIIAQLSLFFKRASSFSTFVAKMVCVDLSFRKCQMTVEEIVMLLDPIKVHIKAASAVCNRCEEALTLISCKWDVDVEECIRCQGLVEQSLKLIASVANQRDVSDLKTGLLLANTQGVRRIMEGKTFYSRRLFLTPQDWQMCKENLVLSRDLLDVKLHDAEVHLNLAREICVGRLLLPVSERTTPAPTKTTSAPLMPAPPMPALFTPAPPTPALTTLTPIPTVPTPILATPAPTTTPAPTATTPAPTPTSPAATSTTPASSSNDPATPSALRSKVASVVDSKKNYLMNSWIIIFAVG